MTTSAPAFEDPSWFVVPRECLPEHYDTAGPEPDDTTDPESGQPPPDQPPPGPPLPQRVGKASGHGPGRPTFEPWPDAFTPRNKPGSSSTPGANSGDPS